MFFFDRTDIKIFCGFREWSLYRGFAEVSVTVRGALVSLVGVVVTGNTGDLPRLVLGYRVSLTRPRSSTLHLERHPKSVKINGISLIFMDFHWFTMIFIDFHCFFTDFHWLLDDMRGQKEFSTCTQIDAARWILNLFSKFRILREAENTYYPFPARKHCWRHHESRQIQNTAISHERH